MRFIRLAVLLLVPGLSGMVCAGSLTTGSLLFDWEGESFRGYLARPADTDEPLPAILIVHDWMGPRPYFEEMAHGIARRGYVAYVADVYGVRTRPQNTHEAARAAAGLRGGERAELRSRMRGNLEILRGRGDVDGSRIVAIGFCFGGTAVLEMARDGQDPLGVVSFHGNLETPRPAKRENAIKPAVLVLHGDADPYVPEGEVREFQDEMRRVRADWELVKFGGAVHSFTDPQADSPGARFDASAARRSWAICWDFVDELFSGR